jgi:hypothetical protein
MDVDMVYEGGARGPKKESKRLSAAASKIERTSKRSMLNSRAVSGKEPATVKKFMKNMVNSRKLPGKSGKLTKITKAPSEKGCMTIFKEGTGSPAVLKDMAMMTIEELQLLAKCVDHPHDHCGCPSRSSATNCARIAKHSITDEMAALLKNPSQQAGVDFNQYVAGIYAGNSYLNITNIETSFRELLEASHPSAMGVYHRSEQPEYTGDYTIKILKMNTYPTLYASTIAGIMLAGGGAAARKQREELDTLSTKCLTIIGDIDSTDAVRCKAVANFIHSYFSDDPRATIHILNDGNASVKQFMQFKLAGAEAGAGGFIQYLTSQVYMDSATTSDIFHADINMKSPSRHDYDWYTFTEPNRRLGRGARVADIKVETGAPGATSIKVTCTLNNFTPHHIISETITDSKKYSNGPTLDYIARLTDAIAAISVKPANLNAVIKDTSQGGVWPMKDLLNQFVEAYKHKDWAKTKQDLLDFISDWKTFGDGEISRQARQLEGVIGRTIVISVDQNSSTCMRLLGQDGVYSHASVHDMFRNMGTPIEKAGAKEIARLNVLIGIYEHFVIMLRSLVFSDVVRGRMRDELAGLLERFNIAGVTSAGKFAWALKMADIYNFMSGMISTLDYYHSLVAGAGAAHYSTVVASLGAFAEHISSIKLDVEGAGRYAKMVLAELNAPANAMRVPQPVIEILAHGAGMPMPAVADMAMLDESDRPTVYISLIKFNDMFEAFVGRNIAHALGPLEKAHTDLMSFGRVIRMYSADHTTYVNNLIYSYDFTNPANGFGVSMSDFIELDATYTMARELMRNAPDRYLASSNKFVDLPSAELKLTNNQVKYISIYDFTNMLHTLRRSFKSATYTMTAASYVQNVYNELNAAIHRLGSGDALVAKADTIFENYAEIIKNSIIARHSAAVAATHGGSRSPSKDADQAREAIVNTLKLLTELHLAAGTIDLLDIKSVKAPTYTYSPPSNTAIRSSDYYKKYIAQRGPEVAEFAEKLYDTYSKTYPAHTLIDTLDIDTLDALYSLKNGGLAAAPATPTTPAEIKNEIKKAEEHIATLKSELTRQTRRQRQSQRQPQPTTFQPILSAIKEESVALSRSQHKSPEKVEGLWEKLGDMLKKGASPTREESAKIRPMLKSAVKERAISSKTAETITLQLSTARSETRRGIRRAPLSRSVRGR